MLISSDGIVGVFEIDQGLQSSLVDLAIKLHTITSDGPGRLVPALYQAHTISCTCPYFATYSSYKMQLTRWGVLLGSAHSGFHGRQNALPLRRSRYEKGRIALSTVSLAHDSVQVLKGGTSFHPEPGHLGSILTPSYTLEGGQPV